MDDSEQFNGVAYIPYSNAKKMTTSQPFTWNGVDYYVASYYVNANGMENIPNARETVYTALEEVWGENCMFQSFSFRLPLLPILAAFTVTVAVGLIFGAYPAAKAAKMEIVQALRPE